MDDILDYIAGVVGDCAGWPVLLGMTAGAPDEAIIIGQYDASPPFHTFGGVYYTYGVKVDTRSKDVRAARGAMRKIEAALRQNLDGEYAIYPAKAVMYAGQDEKQRHQYTTSYKVIEM
jgi:hypothetical protein